MSSYDSPVEGLSRPHQSLPTPNTTKVRSSFVLGSSSEGLATNAELEPIKIFQEFLQASIDATNGQKELVKEERKVEKEFKKLNEMNQKVYIDWKARCKNYRQRKGKDKMVDLMDSDMQEYCAEYICELELDDFLLLENSEITDLLDTFFDINEANYYESTLVTFFMKPKEFSRVDVEDYCTAFLGALQKNPNFLNPDCGGAHPKIINRMFLAGLQTSHFRLRIEKYDTETVKGTLTAIKKVLPRYQESIAMDMVPSVKFCPPQQVMTKARSSTLPSTTSSAAGAPSQSQTKICNNCNKQGHTHWNCNCNKPGHTHWKCKSKCVRCPPGTPEHNYWHETMCKYRQSELPKWKGQQQAKANVVVVSDSSAEVVALKAALAAMTVERDEALNVKLQKLKILDSGANISIISDITHVDTNTVPFCRRAEDAAGVETASGAMMPISGCGTIVGVEGKICEEASFTMISVPQVCVDRDACMFFDSVGAIAVVNDGYVQDQCNSIKKHSIKHNQLLFTGTMSDQSLYELDPAVPKSTPTPISVAHTYSLPLPTNDDSAMSHGTEAWRSSPELKDRHNRWADYHKRALASFYNTAEFQTHRDLVRFFHEAWDHPSRELMIKIVDSKAFDNIPVDLTSKRIRKHFPHCEACPANNMAQKPIPREASDRVIAPGEEFQVDIKVFANNSKALKHKRAFGRYTGALTAIDLSTRYKIGTLIRSHANLEVHLEALRVQIHGSGHTLMVLRLDNEFMTQDIKTWAAECEPPILLQPCIPHEHHSIGDIEKTSTRRCTVSHI